MEYENKMQTHDKNEIKEKNEIETHFFFSVQIIQIWGQFDLFRSFPGGSHWQQSLFYLMPSCLLAVASG